MQHEFLHTSIEFLKGVGPQRADVLKKELAMHTFGDLLYHFPFRYVDRTHFYSVNELNAEFPYVQVKGVLKNIELKGHGRKQFLTATLEDRTGKLDLTWFQGIRFLKNSFKTGHEYIVFGKPSVYNGYLKIVHPEMELASESDKASAALLSPVYNTTEKLKSKGLDSRGIVRLQKSLQMQLPSHFSETLPDELLKQHHLISRTNSLRYIHFPESAQQLMQAQLRLKFEELFFIQLRLLIQKLTRKEKYKGVTFDKVGPLLNDFYNHHLPFPLTNAQKKVIREIRSDFAKGKQMNRLLQGDVGSGKTLVACMNMLIAIDNGYQTCLMAPTEILSQQHEKTLKDLLRNLPVNIALLTGSTKTAERKRILDGLLDGSIQILVGTHALIEEVVQFKNLGFVVIDEQHRFGVEQRSKLHLKGNAAYPHILVMTATPIPRTLAMTLYGDLDISVIDEMPPGRKPVKTIHRFDSHRMSVWGFLKEQIAQGRQVYIVYPLIEESAKLDLKNLMDGYESICRDFPRPQYQASIVHGKMKNSDKDYEMQRFIKGETQIMVATSVIEVGVNVPNASVMIIENAERFGLSQLHQLRGRVGRGADQSYCILMSSEKLGNDARQRLRTMTETNDGFKIAEMDMQLRGAGDMQGTQQSGIPEMKIADLAKDQQILLLARDSAIQLLEKDPHLTLPGNSTLKRYIENRTKNKSDWSRVS